MRERGDKFLQVAAINHSLKGDIFPGVSRVHSDPGGVTTNLRRGPYILLHPATPPSSLLTPYMLQRALPHQPLAHVHMHGGKNVSEGRIPRSLLHRRCRTDVGSSASNNLFCVCQAWPGRLFVVGGVRWSLWGSHHPRQKTKHHNPVTQRKACFCSSSTRFSRAGLREKLAPPSHWCEIQQRDAISTTKYSNSDGHIRRRRQPDVCFRSRNAENRE